MMLEGRTYDTIGRFLNRSKWQVWCKLNMKFRLEQMKEMRNINVAQLNSKHKEILSTIPKRYDCKKVELFSSITYSVLSSEHPLILAIRIHVQNKNPITIKSLGLQLIKDADINEFVKNYPKRQTSV